MKVPYFNDPTQLLARLSPLGSATLLDSGGSERGRWDIATAGPATTLELPPTATTAEIDSFVAGLLALEAAIDDSPSTLPFAGGLVGFLSYELGRRLQGLPAAAGVTQPLAIVRLHRWAVVQDRRERSSQFVGLADTATEAAADIAERLKRREDTALSPFALAAPFRSPWTPAEYEKRFRRVMKYISAGDCYQMNLGQPFTSPYNGDLLGAYALLRDVARAPYSAFFPFDERSALLSLSPERFLTVAGGEVDTYPIKGTRPRAADPARDRALAFALQNSEKERAENLMIVDLLRNDIGRFCATGSVRVERLFELESYRTVHHLVSHVRGRLGEDISPLALLLGCLPGGSITGAPKYRAMQLIDELEPMPRESWCGSLFTRSAGGRLDSSILIRTLYGDGRNLSCWAGGGLVADSDAAAEYAELEHKVGAFLRCLEASA
jgi:para-aminobenzoate synthetase component 1